MDGVYYDATGNFLGIELSEEDIESLISKKKCVICGKEFIPINNRQITCGSEECKRERARITGNERRKELKKNNPELVRKQAREAMRRRRERKKNDNN